MFGKISILLLQARRNDDSVLIEERSCFVEKSGLDPEQFHPHNLVDGPPTAAMMARHDALMVGGSGDFSIARGNLPHLTGLDDFLKLVIDRGFPTFASCFGFQALIAGLGGRVVEDEENIETGTFELELTSTGRNDELFGFLPHTFLAQAGHKDRAESLPPDFHHLASSRLCPYHAVRVGDGPIWATQFHPELTGPENLQRFQRYFEGYSGMVDRNGLEAVLDGFRDSPEANGLIRRFLDLVFAS